MTEPTRDEVRAWLLQLTRSHPRPGPLAARALALLDEGEKDRERLESETRRAVIYRRQLEELRDALGIPVGQTWHARVKTLLVAEAERDAAVKARDVAETAYYSERREVARLQRQLDERFHG